MLVKLKYDNIAFNNLFNESLNSNYIQSHINHNGVNDYINDSNFLNYISQNAKKWYDDNIKFPNNINNIIISLNL